MKKIHTILLLCFCLITINCKPNKNKYSKSLILLDSAKLPKYTMKYETQQLSYYLNIKYPALNAINEISKNLLTQGWTILNNDAFNPGLENSHVSGWTSFLDSSKGTDYTIHQWMADWKNSKGDIVRYCFQYHCPDKKNNNMNELLIIGTYIPMKEFKKYPIAQ